MSLEINQLSIVRIVWEDSSTNSRWIEKDNLIALVSERYLIDSVGFLAYQDDDCKVLVTSIAENTNVCGFVRIPKNCIKSEAVIWEYKPE